MESHYKLFKDPGQLTCGNTAVYCLKLKLDDASFRDPLHAMVHAMVHGKVHRNHRKLHRNVHRKLHAIFKLHDATAQVKSLGFIRLSRDLRSEINL